MFIFLFLEELRPIQYVWCLHVNTFFERILFYLVCTLKRLFFDFPNSFSMEYLLMKKMIHHYSTSNLSIVSDEQSTSNNPIDRFLYKSLRTILQIMRSCFNKQFMNYIPFECNADHSDDSLQRNVICIKLHKYRENHTHITFWFIPKFI